MRRLATVLIALGMLVCLIGVGVLMSAGTVAAQSLPERPTLTPLPVGQESKKSDPIATSRITGTVIDTLNGAPAAGISVQVGDVLVTTDANGNYDRNGLSAGTYDVALVLPATKGTAEQATVSVSVAEAATVVQHLRFHSPAPAPDVTPAVVPQTLPVTAGSEPGMILLIVGGALILAGGLARRRV